MRNIHIVAVSLFFVCQFVLTWLMSMARPDETLAFVFFLMVFSPFYILSFFNTGRYRYAVVLPYVFLIALFSVDLISKLSKSPELYAVGRQLFVRVSAYNIFIFISLALAVFITMNHIKQNCAQFPKNKTIKRILCLKIIAIPCSLYTVESLFTSESSIQTIVFLASILFVATSTASIKKARNNIVAFDALAFSTITWTILSNLSGKSLYALTSQYAAIAASLSTIAAYSIMLIKSRDHNDDTAPRNTMEQDI